jgi:AraC-like DNA-binding protein
MNDSVKRGHPLSPHPYPEPVTQRDGSSCNEAVVARCVALVTDWDDRDRLHAALSSIAKVAFLDSVADVLPQLRADRTGVRAVILEARDASGRPAAGVARQVTRLFPTIPVIGYCSARAEDSQDIIALASAGVHELIYKRHDDHAPLLRNILLRADQQCAGDLVMHLLESRLPPRLRPLVGYCVSYPESAHAVEDVAWALGVNRKTLANHCKAERFPPPGAVVAWCLILLTAALLATPGVTVERIAVQLNFPSATALRNLVKRHTGLRPAALRTPTALAELCTRFLEKRIARTHA